MVSQTQSHEPGSDSAAAPGTATTAPNVDLPVPGAATTDNVNVEDLDFGKIFDEVTAAVEALGRFLGDGPESWRSPLSSNSSSVLQ